MDNYIFHHLDLLTHKMGIFHYHLLFDFCLITNHTPYIT